MRTYRQLRLSYLFSRKAKAVTRIHLITTEFIIPQTPGIYDWRRPLPDPPFFVIAPGFLFTILWEPNSKALSFCFR